MLIYSERQVQIEIQDEIQVGILLIDKAPIEILAKYSNYNNVFLAENIVEFTENTRINEHAIKLKEDKQLLFSLFYNLRLVKLKTLKIYIKTNLANNFIRLSKSSAGASIFFDKKSDKSLYLYINYQNLNNITIKN